MVEGLSRDAVLAYLRANPELIAELLPPPEDRDETVVDFQRHLISRLQQSLTAQVADHDELVDASRGNLASQQQIHEAALALLRAPDLAALVGMVAQDLPDMLHVDVALLCLEDGTLWPDKLADAVLFLSPSLLNAQFDNGQAVSLRTTDEASVEFFGPAADLICSQAMLRLDLRDEDGVLRSAVLALGDRNPETFEPGQGTQLLRFMAEIIAVRLVQLMPPGAGQVVEGADSSRWSQPDA